MQITRNKDHFNLRVEGITLEEIEAIARVISEEKARYLLLSVWRVSPNPEIAGMSSAAFISQTLNTPSK